MLEYISKTVSRSAGILAGLILVAMTGYTLVEIILRSTTGVSTNVLTEFVGYGLASMTMLGAAQTLRDGGLIRVSILLRFMPPGIRRFLDGVCLLSGIAVVSLSATYFFFEMQRSYLRGYETDGLIPLPAWLPPLGLFIGTLAFIVELTCRFILVLSGRSAIPGDAPEAT